MLQFREVKARCLDLHRINGDDFEILPTTERHERIVGSPAGMLAAKASSYAGPVLQELNSTGEVRHSEDQVIHEPPPPRSSRAVSQPRVLEYVPRPSATSLFSSSTTSISTIAVVLPARRTRATAVRASPIAGRR